MHILFISRWFPCRPDNGSKIRVLSLLKHLSKHHEITLVSFAQEPVSRESLVEMKAYCYSVHAVPYREFRPNKLKTLPGIFSSWPRSIVDTYSLEMQAFVQRVGADSLFDVVVASQIDCALYALLLKQIPHVLEEIELAVLYEHSARQRSLVSKARHGLTWWKQSRFLARLLRGFEGVTVVSERERDLVMRIVPGYEQLTIVPNGVDLEANAGEFGVPQPDTLIYSGALTYSANLDAMEFFLRDVFPLVKSRCPGVRLSITGCYDGVPVERLPLGQDVALTGYLDDIRPAVTQSWACVVPLRVGGGTRLKILEAMALGTPVVSTSKGAEGLEVTPDENILIADEPTAFAGAIVCLLGDPELRNKLVIGGQRLVRERYGWDRSGEKLDQFLHQIVRDYRCNSSTRNDTCCPGLPNACAP
jgi:glycosyltransferase involved in cell wall biosynthesis